MTDLIGIIAGSGSLVRQVIECCETNSKKFIIIAFDGQTDPTLLEGRPYVWTKLGKIGQTLQLLRQHCVKQIVMAGRFHRPSWHQLQVDTVGLKWIARLARAFGDDSVIKIIIELLENEGFQIISPESIVGQQLFVKSGSMTKITPNHEFMMDIKRGQYLLQQMSVLDVGQAIVIQQGITLGIEAIEGTDELITRCHRYVKSGPGPVLIKMCKHDQETRVDRATVGPDTLTNLIKYKYAGLAIEASNVIVLDAPLLINQANAAGLFLYGI